MSRRSSSSWWGSRECPVFVGRDVRPDIGSDRTESGRTARPTSASDGAGPDSPTYFCTRMESGRTARPTSALGRSRAGQPDLLLHRTEPGRIARPTSALGRSRAGQPDLLLASEFGTV